MTKNFTDYQRDAVTAASRLLEIKRDERVTGGESVLPSWDIPEIDEALRFLGAMHCLGVVSDKEAELARSLHLTASQQEGWIDKETGKVIEYDSDGFRIPAAML